MDDVNQQTTPPQPQSFRSIPSSFTPPEQNPPPAAKTNPDSIGANWTKWVLLIIFVALLSSFGTYFVLTQTKKQPIPTPTIIQTPSSTPNETANWKTYMNEEYGYLFKHPEQTSIDDKTKDYIWLDRQISIQVTSKDPEDCQGACRVIQERKNIEINGVDAKELNGGFGIIGGNVPHRFRSVVIPHNNQYYEIMVYEIKHDDKLLLLSPEREIEDIPENQLKLFHQILSTFRFD